VRIEITVHAPERRRRATTLVACGSCCSCCCVHTLGGLLGAAWGSLRRHGPREETLRTEWALREEREVSAAHRTAARIYWLTLAILATLTIAIGMVTHPHEPVGLFLILGFLPLWQLAASALSTIYVGCRAPKRQDIVLRRLGSITVWAVAGAVIGLVGSFLSLIFIVDKM
jgi:hypothetical protein